MCEVRTYVCVYFCEVVTKKFCEELPEDWAADLEGTAALRGPHTDDGPRCMLLIVEVVKFTSHIHDLSSWT